MKYLSIIFLVFLLAAPLPVKAADKLSTKTGDLDLYRNGQVVKLSRTAQIELKKRINTSFNKNDADTSEVWFRNEFEQKLVGKTVEEKWNTLKEKSYISFLPEISNRKSKSKIKRTKVVEVLIELKEDNLNSAFGAVLAKLSTGEIRAYNVSNEWLTRIYCLDLITDVIPSHYEVLANKYSAEEYSDMKLNCTTTKTKEK